MTAVINPLGTIAPEVPSLTEIIVGDAKSTSVGGSYYLCIDPSKFGPIADVKAKFDRFAEAIENTQSLPNGRGCRMPGASGWKSLESGAEEVKVLAIHWSPFFDTQAGRHGWTEESLQADFDREQSKG